MMQVEQFIALLHAHLPRELFEVLPPPPTMIVNEKPTFYVHFSQNDLRIQSISANPIPENGSLASQIDFDLGLKFVNGEINPIHWKIVPKRIESELIYELSEIKQPTKVNRLDLDQPIYMVEKSGWADVRLDINRKKGLVDIHYDGDKIKDVLYPVKLYFTRENDPAYLKCAFSLDVNILNQIVDNNSLTEWPNPIRLRVDQADDLSVFAIRGPLSVCILEKNDKARNKRV